jgi:hypothetical protein
VKDKDMVRALILAAFVIVTFVRPLTQVYPILEEYMCCSDGSSLLYSLSLRLKHIK